MKVALVGIGGYGHHYLGPLLDPRYRDRITLVGGIDSFPSSCKRLSELNASEVPIYSTLEDFYAKHDADLVVICTPPHLHCEHACLALKHGSHVLCEKPLCVTTDQARQMIATRDAARRHVAIGYQWSYSDAIQTLKSDIRSGLFGRPRRLRTLVLWPRDEAYYKRNGWAGRIRDGQGRWILDSPVNNACAHHLHNMLYLLGNEIDCSVQISRLTCERYRTHEIENYDTAAMRVRIADDIELLFIASHATAIQKNPTFVYEFDRGVIEFADSAEASIIARFPDGSSKNYGSPNNLRENKLLLVVDRLRPGKSPLCGIEAAGVHTSCVWAAQQSSAPIADISRDGLAEALQHCYSEFTLPSDSGASWALPSDWVAVDQI
jgi:predicted dehydrogenase